MGAAVTVLWLALGIAVVALIAAAWAVDEIRLLRKRVDDLELPNPLERGRCVHWGCGRPARFTMGPPGWEMHFCEEHAPL